MSPRRFVPRLALPWWLWPTWIAAVGVWGWDLGSGAGGWTVALDAIPAALLLAVAALWGGRRSS